MIKKANNLFVSLYNKQIDAKGLAIFRIAFSLVLLGEVLQLFYFRHLIFDKIPFLNPSEIEMWPILLFWSLSIIFIIFGLFTRIASIINYILAVCVIGTISSYEYHMFYSYLLISFLFIILPISKTFSFDRLLLKLKYSNTRFEYRPPQTVSVLSYYVPIILGIGFVYFDSIFFKITSHLWLNGLGMWLPASVPQAVFINISSFLNLKFVVLTLGYLTFAFELLFIFLFWRKKWRVPLLLIGIGLHIGILICFPIPFFALGVIAIYLLMVPVKWWQKIFNNSKESRKLLKFYYDAECPLCNRTRIIIKYLDSNNKIEFLTVQQYAHLEPSLKDINFEYLLDDIYSVDTKGKVFIGLDTYIKVFNSIWYLKPLSWIIRIPGIYHIGLKVYKYIAINRSTERCTEENCGYVLPNLPVDEEKLKVLQNFTLKDLKIKVAILFLSLGILLQVITSFNSKFPKVVREQMGISNSKVIKVSEYIASRIQNFSTVFWGITHHAVFMDNHFDDYNHIIGVVYKSDKKNIWLPIINERGTPGNYLYGPNWVKWTFRVNGTNINQKQLSDGLRDFTAFWAHKNSVKLEEATFEVLVKKVKVPKEFRKDFLNNQLDQPWLNGGFVYWKNEKFIPDLKIIEEL